MKKILVVDDDAEIVDLMRARLEANHYKVVTAFNGEEGLQKAEDENPNLIILDVAMPIMDGYTFVLELKKKNEFRGIPLIVLTAKDKMKTIFNIEGVNNYFVKPFISDDILATLKDVLGE